MLFLTAKVFCSGLYWVKMTGGEPGRARNETSGTDFQIYRAQLRSLDKVERSENLFECVKTLGLLLVLLATDAKGGSHRY